MRVSLSLAGLAAAALAAAPALAEPQDGTVKRSYTSSASVIERNGYIDGNRVPGFIFTRADDNGDGVLTGVEIRRARKDMKDHERDKRRKKRYLR